MGMAYVYEDWKDLFMEGAELEDDQRPNLCNRADELGRRLCERHGFSVSPIHDKRSVQSLNTHIVRQRTLPH